MPASHLYADNFNEIINKIQGIALVDFWSSWCVPCRMIAPIIEEIADDYDGSLDVFKVDVDEAGDVASEHGVLSIPTIIIFKDGEEQERLVGYRPKEELVEMINRYL